MALVNENGKLKLSFVSNMLVVLLWTFGVHKTTVANMWGKIIEGRLLNDCWGAWTERRLMDVKHGV